MKLERLFALKRDRAFLQAVVLTAGRVAALALQIVTIRFFTTLIAPVEVGRYYLLLAAQTWATLLLLGAPSMYLWRNFLEWRKRDLHLRALAIFFGYCAGVALVSLPVFWIAVHLGFVSTRSALATSVVLVIWLVAATAMNVLAMALNLVQSRVASVLVATGSSVLALLGALFAISLTASRTAEVWIGGLAAGTAIAAIAGAVWLRRVAGLQRAHDATAQRLEPDGSLWRSVWLFSWPIAVITGLYWVQSQGYRRILLTTAGESGVGVFAVAWSIGATMGIAVDQILQQWILPPFFHRVADGRSVESIDALWQEYFAAVLRLLIPLAALTAAASPFLLRLLAGPTFQLHPMLPVWAAVSETFHVVANLFYLGGIARRQTREMVLPFVPGVIWVLAAVHPASARFGLHGAGAAVFVSYLVLGVVMWWTVQRRIFSKVTMRDLTAPSAFGLLIILFCAIAGLAGWQASLTKAAVTVVIAGLLFAGGALTGLPRLLALTQPPSENEQPPIEASVIEEAPCL
ncbi:MAG TPA: hypothetical protein VN181_03255 [Thermoanaerobaculia bacterium]|nr:hypothetical protein [Thermoanaerobaculia bacterium]